MKDLYLKLKEAYSDKNLNRITAKIIELYKSKDYDSIKFIINKISKYIEIDNKNISRCFSKLVMIYHPDRGTYYSNELEKCFRNGDSESLNKFSHILMIQDMEEVHASAEILDDIDYTPEYVWDYENYSSFSEYEEVEEDFYPEDYSFFNTLKRKIYGRIDIDLPVYYLEDLDEIEMVGYEINSLEGVEYCKYAVNADFSRNQITDISELWNLIRLEELYLSDNQIGYIDSLSNLKRLRIIDLSNNYIDDISPLFDLEHLEYVNLSGNTIPDEQIEELIARDVIVIYS
jgi:Leucine-rich repeat (LRR) protein